WPDQDAPAGAAAVGLRLLFDDPDLVDAEPVAVYPRKVDAPPAGAPTPTLPDLNLNLAGGRKYRGPSGAVMITALYAAAMNDLPGQQTDAGEGPVFGPPPEGAIARLKIYAARRDRFDDPQAPRIPGKWELLLEVEASASGAGGAVPAASPTVLAG